MVPHLVTALSGPLLDLEEKILAATPAIERWFRLEWQEHTPPFYCSVDMRNAGYKLAPVDTNLFPGGFNMLATEMLPLSVQAAMAAIDKYCPDARNLLLIPETTQRHPTYWQNVARLMQIFRQTGLHVRLGSLSPDVTQPTPLLCRMAICWWWSRWCARRTAAASASRISIRARFAEQRPVGRHPDILQNIHEQSLLPPLHAGWALRRKSNHLNAYDEVVKKFGKLIGVDPWMLNPFHAKCDAVNFRTGEGYECLAANVDALLAKIKKKYKEYGIKDQKPFVIVKPDAGTYGTSILTIKDSAEIKDLTQAQRDKMIRHQGWQGSHRLHHPGRRADVREHRERRGRAGGVHDRPLRGGRLLPHPRREGHRPEPERARLAVRAAGVCAAARGAGPEGQAGHGRAEPLLRVWRGGAPGAAGGVAGNGTHRPESGSAISAKISHYLYWTHHENRLPRRPAVDL
jgi:glutamate--cysteine ligase